tara:strand:+ start:2548 stop:3048 length:501 start_codon:yes stop_codon:yes gene_type:complete
MATALLITRDDIVRFTNVNGNVDVDKFIQFVLIAQDIHIQSMLGTKLLEKIQADIIAGTLANPYLALLTTYIKPCLIHFAMVEYLPYAAYTVANKGVYKHGAENSETVSKEEVDFMIEKQRQTAMHYKERFVDFIINNSALFPEYNANEGEDMFPNDSTNLTGWCL